MDSTCREAREWDVATIDAFREEIIADLRARLEGTAYSVLKTVPREFGLSVVVESDDNLRWINVVVDDVRRPECVQNVSLRRMSSQRDWKGEAFHYCAWDDIGAAIAEYMKPEYDSDLDLDW